MIKMKLQSWLLLAVLAVVAAFAAGIRQGISVERRNILKEQNLRVQSVATTPSPTQPVDFKDMVDEKCNIRYLLPSNIASDSGTISINCDTPNSTTSAKLQEQGYMAVSVASKPAKLDMWIKAPKNLESLILRTIQSNNADN